MRPLKILALILGLLFALVGLASVTSGGFVLGIYGTQRDPAGFFSGPEQQVGSYGFALTAPDVNGSLGPRWERWVPTWANVTVRIEGWSELEAPIFIGVGPTARVSAYLAGVPHDRIDNIDLMSQSVAYSHVDGTKRPTAPSTQGFWVAKEEGVGPQALEWELQAGDWTVVIMNADRSAPLAATMKFGAQVGALRTVMIALTAGGAVLLAIGATLMYFGGRRRRRPLQPGYPEPGYPPLWG